MVDGVAARGLELLADARATDNLIRELQDAADEGMAVVASSPFRIRHRPDIRRMADLVEPLDRALRSTRVLVRQTAVAAYYDRPVPKSYSLLAFDLADAADAVADELAADRMAVAAREPLLAVGEATGLVERADELTAEVVLGQLRSVVVDLLLLTGMSQIESTEALPASRRRDETTRGRGPDRALGAARGPRPVHRRGRGAASPRAGRAAGDRRRRRRPDQARGGVHGVLRGAGVRRRAPGWRCGWRRGSARTRCSCRSTGRPTTRRRRA